MLSSKCDAMDGSELYSEINLDWCIQNNGGNLEHSEVLVYLNIALNAAVVRYILRDISIYRGRYSQTCSSCEMDGTVLKCNCITASGNVTSSIDTGRFFNTLDFINYCIRLNFL